MTGRVTQVNEKVKTFTVMSKGKEAQTGGEPLEATNLNSSRSNIF